MELNNVQSPANSPSTWTLILFVMQTISLVLKILVKGPKRPNRTRILEVLLKITQSSFGSDSLSVKDVRYFFNKVSTQQPLPAKLQSVIDACTFKPINVNAILNSGSSIPAAATKLTDIHFESSLPYTTSSSKVLQATAEWIYPPEYTDKSVILYIHGGGFILNSAAGYRKFLSPIATRLKHRILSLDYQLAPESRFPNAIHESVAVYLYLLKTEKIASDKIILMGDSAGGNLTMALALFLRNHSLPQPGCIVLYSPYTDLRSDLPSIIDNDHLDLITIAPLNAEINVAMCYLGPTGAELCAREELCSPSLAHPHEQILPPVYIASGRDEILLDDNILFVANLVQFGIARTVIHDIFVDQFHVFQIIIPDSVDTEACHHRVEQFIHLCLGAEAGPLTGAEITLIKDGHVKYCGIEETWLNRWDGIMHQRKDITWVPNVNVHKIL